MNKRVTIKDVAKMANASVAAVSMSLNNRPGIGDEKRLKIIEIAKKAGYQPSLVAKALVNKRSYIIGLIINDISDHFFAELAKVLRILQKNTVTVPSYVQQMEI